MRCGEARRRLWPDGGPQLATREVEAAQAHLAACEACRRFIGAMREAAEEFRAAAPRPLAPPAVRERVFGAVALARARAEGLAVRERSRRLAGAGLALGVVGLIVAIGVGAGVWWARGDARDWPWRIPIAAVAEDHVRAVSDPGIASSDPEAVADYLAPRVPFAVNVPLLPEGTLEGGRLCFLNGQRGVALRYRVGGRVVSYYVMPAPAEGSPAPDPRRFRHGAGAGYNVVAWRDAGLFHALVSDLPAARLSDLARRSAAPSSS